MLCNECSFWLLIKEKLQYARKFFHFLEHLSLRIDREIEWDRKDRRWNGTESVRIRKMGKHGTKGIEPGKKL